MSGPTICPLGPGWAPWVVLLGGRISLWNSATPVGAGLWQRRHHCEGPLVAGKPQPEAAVARSGWEMIWAWTVPTLRVRGAGCTAVQRNTFYEPIKVWDALVPLSAEPNDQRSKVLEDNLATA